MVNKKDNNDFTPRVAIAPGETIRENINYLGMNQKELAARLDITEKHVSNIINGNSPITYETALKLEAVIGPSAQFWMNLESNYQLTKARLGEEKKMNEDLEILKSIPYKEMSDFNWVEKTRKRKKRVINCRRFFGVAELSTIEFSYSVAFRKQNQTSQISNLGTLAWLRKAEKKGLDIDLGKFDKKKLEELIPRFREMTMEDPEVFYPEMKSLCAECGVAFVIVPYLPKTDICGATIWRNHKPILALSVRGKKADIFWFTFFHELAHLINHSNKELHINYDSDSKEAEADKQASNYLIPEEEYKEFINNYNYKDRENIINYAKKIGIAPFILLGRLQHDKLLGYQHYRDLIPFFEIVDVS